MLSPVCSHLCSQPRLPPLFVCVWMQALKLLGIADFEDVFDLTIYDLIHPSPEQQQEWCVGIIMKICGHIL